MQPQWVGGMYRAIVAAAVLVTAIFGAELPGLAQSASPPLKTIESCRAIPTDAERLRCFEDATSNFKEPPTSPKTADGWRMVRTPGPKPGTDVISMMRTADLLRSDPQFAGLSLHCGENGPEVLIITVEPFPPRSRPRVTIGEAQFEASVLPSGAALMLPPQAMTLATGSWQSQSSLAIKIEEGGSTIRGVVPIGGMSAALNTLSASCTANK